MIEFERIVHIRDSWAIDEIAYSAQRHELRLSFPQTKTVWLFSEVPPNVFTELLLADSVGEYFNQHIRNQFEAVRVSLVPPENA